MIILGYSDVALEHAKQIIEYLENNKINYEVVKEDSIFGISVNVVAKVLKNKEKNKGIILDDYGIAPFIVAGKFKGIICAELNDEHSAFMTRDHNNSNVISLGTNVIGKGVSLSIIRRFIESDFSGGRHQIRIDMLDEMGEKLI